MKIFIFNIPSSGFGFCLIWEISKENEILLLPCATDEGLISQKRTYSTLAKTAKFHQFIMVSTILPSPSYRCTRQIHVLYFHTAQLL